ncbi:MAG: PCRF domain-containing protein, partial [Rickettsiales bacterium]|nr:PCRF domain-containing protein [Rickettsiales bacterium]
MWNTCGGVFDRAAIDARLAELDALAASPSVYGDKERACGIFAERRELEGQRSLLKSAEDFPVLKEFALAGDESALGELDRLAKSVSAGRLGLMFSGEADQAGAYVEIHAGAGGTEAQDWAQMLERMYIRWADAHGRDVRVMDERDGDGAGVKSAT